MYLDIQTSTSLLSFPNVKDRNAPDPWDGQTPAPDLGAGGNYPRDPYRIDIDTLMLFR